jgi:glutathione S-transferase
MAEVIIHGVNGSPFVRAVQVTLEEKRQPYRLAEMGPGDSRGEAHLKRHPFGRVPALEHGDFQIYETQAILRYLDAVFPEPPLQPTDARTIGRMNQIIGVNDCYLFPKVAAVVVFNRIVGPALMGIKPNEEAIEAALPDARLCLGELERLMGENTYFVGDRPTLADMMLAPQLDFLAATPEGARLLAGTRLQAWLGRMNARPSMVATQRPAMFRAAA